MRRDHEFQVEGEFPLWAEFAPLGSDMADLAAARLGVHMLVRTTVGTPSYWLVPLETDDRCVGFVRVTSAGETLSRRLFVTPAGHYDGAAGEEITSEAE